jgi:hypothetical protein
VTVWLCCSKYNRTCTAARESTWTDSICPSKYKTFTRISEKNLVIRHDVNVKNRLIKWFYLVLTTVDYRMKLRNDRMTKEIELLCKKQNHLRNIGLWRQQTDTNNEERFERATKEYENQIKRKTRLGSVWMIKLVKETGLIRSLRYEQDGQCTNNVTLRRVRVTIVVVEKHKYYI